MYPAISSRSESPFDAYGPSAALFVLNVHLLGTWQNSKAWLVYSMDWQKGRKIRPLAEICARVERKSVVVRQKEEAEDEKPKEVFRGTVLNPEAVGDQWVVFRLEERPSRRETLKSWLCVPLRSADPYSCHSSHSPHTKDRDVEGWRSPDWPLPFPDRALSAIRDTVLKTDPWPSAGILHIRSPNPVWRRSKDELTRYTGSNRRAGARELRFASNLDSGREGRGSSSNEQETQKRSQDSEVSGWDSDSEDENEEKKVSRQSVTPSFSRSPPRGSFSFLPSVLELFRRQ